MSVTIYSAPGTSDIFDEQMLEEQYAEIIGDEYPNGLTIAGLTYDAATVLRAVDPIAYQCGFADFLSNYDEHSLTTEQWFDTDWDDLPALLGLTDD